MPRAKAICSTSGCIEPSIRDGKCSDHGRKPWANTSKRNLSRPGNWNSLRKAVRARDKVCQKCGGTSGLEVDHRKPISMGGTWFLSNLWLLCFDCHRSKTLGDMFPGRK